MTKKVMRIELPFINCPLRALAKDGLYIPSDGIFDMQNY